MNFIDELILKFASTTNFFKVIGSLLIALPTVWDIAKMGLMGLVEKQGIAITIPGLICMLVGAFIIYLAGVVDGKVGS